MPATAGVPRLPSQVVPIAVRLVCESATMQAQATTLSDQDIEDIAAYFTTLTGDES